MKVFQAIGTIILWIAFPEIALLIFIISMNKRTNKAEKGENQE
jgi:hypothetical protein